METLTVVGGIASIVGVCISFAALALVLRLRAAIKRHSRHRQLTEIIDRILRIPRTKETMSESTCAEIRFVVRTARHQDFSVFFFLDRAGKRIAQELEEELQGQKRRQILQNNLKLLRDELTIV